MKNKIQKLRDEFNKKLDALEKKLLSKVKWQKIGDLYFSEDLGEKNWHDAKKKCEELGGRLPTRIELMDLVDNHSEEIEDWNKNQYFWSSTEYYTNATHAWYTYLGNGFTYSTNKDTGYYVRCVRR